MYVNSIGYEHNETTKKINKRITDSYSVIKSNNIIGKLHPYNIFELSLIVYTLSHTGGKLESDNMVFETTMSIMKKVFPKMNNKSAYKIMRETVMSLGKKPIELKSKEFRTNGTNGSYIKRDYHNWFRGFSYGNGKIELRLNPDIKEFFVDLKR